MFKNYLCIFPVIVCSSQINGNYFEAIETKTKPVVCDCGVPGHGSITDESIAASFDLGVGQSVSQSVSL